jgi:hypothetical protein
MGATAGRALAGHPGIRKLDLTGGTPTGRAVAAAAGQNLVSVLAELGGKAPMIIFPDADLNQAVNGCAFGSFVASGQVGRWSEHEGQTTLFSASYSMALLSSVPPSRPSHRHVSWGHASWCTRVFSTRSSVASSQRQTAFVWEIRPTRPPRWVSKQRAA